MVKSVYAMRWMDCQNGMGELQMGDDDRGHSGSVGLMPRLPRQGSCTRSDVPHTEPSGGRRRFPDIPHDAELVISGKDYETLCRHTLGIFKVLRGAARRGRFSSDG